MKKLLLPLTLCFIAIFALFFFNQPNFNKIINNQLAVVIGLDMNKVIQWSSQKGF